MEPLKPLKPLGAPQGIKPLSSPQGVKPLTPITKPVADAAPKEDAESFNKLFGGSEPAVKEEAQEIKEVAGKVAQQMVDAVQKKTEKASKAKTKASSKESDGDEESQQAKAVYTGPRHVKVYGNLLFTVEDPKVKMEDIRKRIVEEFGFEEFAASRTRMSLDENTGIVVPEIGFQKKG